jgi:hypothetical protein
MAACLLTPRESARRCRRSSPPVLPPLRRRGVFSTDLFGTDLGLRVNGDLGRAARSVVNVTVVVASHERALIDKARSGSADAHSHHYIPS